MLFVCLNHVAGWLHIGTTKPLIDCSCGGQRPDERLSHGDANRCVPSCRTCIYPPSMRVAESQLPKDVLTIESPHAAGWRESLYNLNNIATAIDCLI